MKRLLLIMLILSLIISCGLSKEEQMLYNYEKQVTADSLNINIDDINFKVIGVEKVKAIKASDSIEILQKQFDEKKNDWIEMIQEDLDIANKRLSENQEKMKKAHFKSIKDMYKENIEDYENNIKVLQGFIDLYNGDCKGTSLEPLFLQISEYKNNPNKVLSIKYKGEYSFENPLMSNVKQTFTKYYYSNPDDTQFLKSEDTGEKS
ncbi:hypothetical protein [Aestuariivivens sediminicola]|uniref:hypothetical protein n=1 Tax=Aestuariivivens sediminicola TaxID=2913560 RepID=UPI001F57DD87|nr:hypothetical protein [Aestuariivivens sediminicola]